MANYQTQTLSTYDAKVKNKVLKNTYFLLSITLMFSAFTAYMTMSLNLPHPGFLGFILGTYGLMYLTHAFKNSGFGIIAVFAFTGFMGYTLGPLLNSILTLSNGSNIIVMSLFSTGFIFLSLSGHVLVSKKDYSFLGGFLFIGVMTAILAMIASILFNIPGLHLAVSAAFILISSGMILFETSQIINGGEKKYLLATVSLYVSIYNLFVRLLHIFSAFGGNRN